MFSVVPVCLGNTHPKASSTPSEPVPTFSLENLKLPATGKQAAGLLLKSLLLKYVHACPRSYQLSETVTCSFYSLTSSCCLPREEYPPSTCDQFSRFYPVLDTQPDLSDHLNSDRRHLPETREYHTIWVGKDKKSITAEFKTISDAHFSIRLTISNA